MNELKARLNKINKEIALNKDWRRKHQLENEQINLENSIHQYGINLERQRLQEQLQQSK